MNFIDERVLNYSIEHSTSPSSDCETLAEHTRQTQPLHRMLCGPLESSLLGFLIKSINAKNVLEIGTFTGYSALAMAEFLPEDGRITTIDKNKKVTSQAKEFWGKSHHGSKITSLNGDGKEVVADLTENYDLIFIDADKASYLDYFKMGLNLLSDKGIIVIDNVLWSGQVIDGFIDGDLDKSTQYIVELNEYVKSREDIFKTFLPIRDGIYLIKKL